MKEEKPRVRGLFGGLRRQREISVALLIIREARPVVKRGRSQ